MDEKLKPCPFCGGKAKVQSDSFNGGEFSVLCKCGASIGEGGSKEHITKKWNQRHTPDKEAVEREIDDFFGANRKDFGNLMARLTPILEK